MLVLSWSPVQCGVSTAPLEMARALVACEILVDSLPRHVQREPLNEIPIVGRGFSDDLNALLMKSKCAREDFVYSYVLYPRPSAQEASKFALDHLPSHLETQAPGGTAAAMVQADPAAIPKLVGLGSQARAEFNASLEVLQQHSELVRASLAARRAPAEAGGGRSLPMMCLLFQVRLHSLRSLLLHLRYTIAESAIGLAPYAVTEDTRRSFADLAYGGLFSSF